MPYEHEGHMEKSTNSLILCPFNLLIWTNMGICKAS